MPSKAAQGLAKEILYPTISSVKKKIHYFGAYCCDFYVFFRKEVKAELFKFFLWFPTIILGLIISGHLSWLWSLFVVFIFGICLLPFYFYRRFLKASEEATGIIIRYLIMVAKEHNEEVNIILRSKMRKRLYTVQERLNNYFSGLDRLRGEVEDDEKSDLVSRLINLNNQDILYILQGRGKRY